MKWKVDGCGPLGRSSPVPRLCFFALLFFCGTVLGQVLLQFVSPMTGDELEQYLLDVFHLLSGDRELPRRFFTCLWLYLRVPLLGFLLGFASLGTVLLPALTITYGLCLSFSVCCLTATFGFDGLVLSAAFLGLRCFVTLPCYFLLAIPAWNASIRLVGVIMGKNTKWTPAFYGKAYWLRFVFCLFALVLGACLEWYCSPFTIQYALGRIFTN